MEEIIKKYGRQVKFDKNITWEEASKLFNAETGLKISGDALRKRYSRIDIDEIPATEYHKVSGDGTIEAQKIVNLSPKEKDKPNAVLSVLGYNPNEWQLDYMLFSNWQQHTKEQTTKQLYAVKFKIKPKVKEIDPLEVIAEINKMFSGGIKPLKIFKTKQNKELNNDKLLEQPAVELHLGELSCWIDTGENYDQKIAQERFRQIVKKTIEKNEYEKCGTLLLGIGNDFFNSDNNNDTTTKGTQQHSDVRWRKMFLVGLALYTEAIRTYAEHFNKVDIQLVSGNHDYTTSFYLYVALEQAFKNCDKINFINDYKEVQCYQFGDCGIWSTHCVNNVYKTILSIVSEFPKEYGATKYRELHTAHLHHEQELKETAGMIPRRLSTPKGTGDYEYNGRFGVSIKKQQLFVWQKGFGLLDIGMIPFEPITEEQETKRR